MTAEEIRDRALCEKSPVYFIKWHCRTTFEGGVFELWDPYQKTALNTIHENQFVIALKARQIGMTTLVIFFVLWRITFRSNITILVFSKGQKEARDFVFKLKMALLKLPLHIRPEIDADQVEMIRLKNGSRIIAYASRASGGDSQRADTAIFDEADLIQDLDLLLAGAKPTLGPHGKLIMLSRPDKMKPESSFKRTWHAAVAGKNGFAHVFIPWHANPEKNEAWYEATKAEILARTGCLDELYEQYPSNPEEALRRLTKDTRFPFNHLKQCYRETSPLSREVCNHPALPGIEVFKAPEPGREYVIGMDVAEGNPSSDDSVHCVMDRNTLEEVCTLGGQFEPALHAYYGAKLAEWYNGAPILVERNNHGHKAIYALQMMDERPGILCGRDERPGWLTDTLGKAMMWDGVAETASGGGMLIASPTTFDQLVSISSLTQRAPEGMKDDYAVAFGVALRAAVSVYITPMVFVINR